MNRFTRFLGTTCDECSFCRYARENPETLAGKIMAWHGTWCPAWKAQKEIEKERQMQSSKKADR